MLLGRDALLDQVGQLVAADRPAVLLGQSGVGKTALMTQLAASSGLQAWWGGGLELLAARPFLAIGRGIQRLDLTGDASTVAQVVEASVGAGLLVMDDLHLADPSSVAVLELLSGRVGLLASACPVPGRGTELVPRLAGAGFVVVPVPPLDDAAARQLASRTNPALTGTGLRQILARSGGIPLLIEELSRGGPDDSLARALTPRLELLSPPARAAALRLSVDRREQVIADRAVAGELVDAGFAVAQGPDRLRIRHGLIAEAVVQAAGLEERQQAHRELADQGGDAAAVAVHLLGAGDLAGAHRAALAAAAAAEALDERAAHLVVAGRAAPAPARWELMLQAAEQLTTGLAFEQAEAALDELDELDRMPEALRVRVCAVRAVTTVNRGDYAGALAHGRAGLALAAGRPALEQQRLLEITARLLFASATGPESEIAELVERALRLSDVTGRRAAIDEIIGLCHFGADISVAERIWRGAMARARAEGDVQTELRCGNAVAVATETNGDPQENLRLCRELMDRAEALGLGQWRALFQSLAGIALHHLGRFAEALHEIDAVDAFPLPRATRQPSAVLRAAVLAELGLTDEARRLFAAWRAELTEAELRGAEVAINETAMRYVQGLIELNSGRPHRVLAITDEVVASGRNLDVLARLAEVSAWAQVDLGVPVTVPTARGQGVMLRGLAAVAEGAAMLHDDPARAATALDRAADELSPYSFASTLRARWGAAEARRRAGNLDAVPRLLAVEAQADAAGLVPLVARIHRSLRLAGVSRSAPRAQDRSGLVTARERQVLNLVAVGWSNADIARRLGVGRPTVRRLIDNARGKLGSPDRVAAAARVTGHG